jgi:hypothetical protein
MAATPEETAIAEWMRDEFTREGRLSQKRAVTEIRQQFGVQHLYRNKVLIIEKDICQTEESRA